MDGSATFGVRLTGDSTGAVRSMTLTRAELERLGREMGQTQRRTREVSGGFRSWASDTLDLKGALAGVTAALSAGALIQGIDNTLKGLQDIQRTAAGLGISIKAVQELSFTFRQFDVDAEDVTEGLAQLSGQALGAVTGSTSLIQTWGQLGITVDQLRDKKPDELFRLLAEGIAQTEDPTVRLAAASSLLGEDLSGKLMPLLVQGAAGIDKFADKANDLNAVLSDKTVKAAGDAAQAFRDLKTSLDASFTKAVADNATWLERLARALSSAGDAAIKAFAHPLDAFAGIPGLQPDTLQGRRDRIEQILRLPQSAEAYNNAIKDYIALDTALRKQQRATLGNVTVTAPRPKSAPINVPILSAVPDSLLRVTPDDLVASQERELAKLDKLRMDDFGKGPASAIGSMLTSLPEVTGSIDDLNGKLKEVSDTGIGFKDIGVQMTASFSDGFADAVFGANSFGDSLKSLAGDVAKLTFKLVLMQSIKTGVSALFGSGTETASANGNVFDQGGLVPFAKGGIVTGPTIFPFKNGTGLMGEAGPEAIMPLMRGRGGKLGVQASGGGVTVNAPITINAPNADKKTVSEIAQITQRLPAMVAHVVVSDMHRDGPISRSIRR